MMFLVMGSGSSNTYCVDDKTTGHVEGFAKSIFIKYEFPTLKVFCNTYDIRQHHLVVVFKSYLSHEEVFLIDFRVRTNDLRRKFLRHSRLNNVSISLILLVVDHLIGRNWRIFSFLRSTLSRSKESKILL